MLIRRLSAIVLIAALLCATGFGQALSPEERAKNAKEKEEQFLTILDRTIAEAGGLRLAQNRVVVNALAGDIYWQYDPERARGLFRTASNDVIAYQADVEKERLEDMGQGMMSMFDPFDPRYEFLNLVGMRDPELGLELMAATRTAALADAMAKIASDAAMNVPAGVASVSFGAGTGTPPAVAPVAAGATAAADRARAQQEIILEQSLTTRAAMGDPEKTIKAIKDSLAKGISTNVYTLLQQLMQKDEKRALELGGDLVNKITGTDLTRNSNDLNGAIGILSISTRPLPPLVSSGPTRTKIFTFTPEQTRDIALKLASTFLQPGAPAFVNNSLPRAMASLEKVVPERAVLLRQRDAQNRKASAPAGGTRPGTPARTWNPSDTPEAIIAAAGKITNPNEKTIALQTAANLINGITDEARAKRLIDSISDQRIRSQAQDRFDAQRINRLTVEGRLDEARAAIAGGSNRRTQIQRLARLAAQIYRRNTEKDREAAAAMINEAKSLASNVIEDEDDLADHMELILGYAVIEPDTAFRMIEPLMDQFNDIIQASAVLSRYNKRDRAFKKGELVMRINGGAGNGMLPFRFLPQIQNLAGADLDRMSMLVDRYQRSDARTLMKLYVLQGHQRLARFHTAQPPPPRP